MFTERAGGIEDLKHRPGPEPDSNLGWPTQDSSLRTDFHPETMFWTSCNHYFSCFLIFSWRDFSGSLSGCSLSGVTTWLSRYAGVHVVSTLALVESLLLSEASNGVSEVPTR